MSEGCGPGREEHKYVQLLEVILTFSCRAYKEALVLVFCVLTWHLKLKLPTLVLYTRLQWNIADRQGPWCICLTCTLWNQRGPGVSSDCSITMHCSVLRPGLARKAGHRFNYSCYYYCCIWLTGSPSKCGRSLLQNKKSYIVSHFWSKVSIWVQWIYHTECFGDVVELFKYIEERCITTGWWESKRIKVQGSMWEEETLVPCVGKLGHSNYTLMWVCYLII